MMVWKIIRGKKESCAPSSSSVRTTLVWRTPFSNAAGAEDGRGELTDQTGSRPKTVISSFAYAWSAHQ